MRGLNSTTLLSMPPVPLFDLLFSLSDDPCDGFHRDSSLIISLLCVAGFSVPITLSCDEDVEEVGEDEVEEVVDRPGTTNGT